MYVSIYVWMSEPLYFVSLAGLLAAGVWSIFLKRKPIRVVQETPPEGQRGMNTKVHLYGGR